MGTKSPSWFLKFSKTVSRIAGTPYTFSIALAVIVVWAVTGPVFGFSDTWQLIINTSTTIITFLMVFLIQNTQNRDAEALQLKLDELIRAVKGADDSLMDVEEMKEDELAQIHRRYTDIADRASEELRQRGSPPKAA